MELENDQTLLGNLLMKISNHYINPQEVAAVSKFYSDFGYTSVKVYYMIHLKGGGEITISSSTPADAYGDMVEKQQTLIEEMEAERMSLISAAGLLI